MITVVAASTITPLKIRNLTVFDAGATIERSGDQKGTDTNAGHPPGTPCSGRPNGKISEFTIGGIATVKKYAPIPITILCGHDVRLARAAPT